MKKFFLSLIGILSIVSCSEDVGDVFKLKLSATLINQGESKALEGEAKEILYYVILSRSLDTDIKLYFDVNEMVQNKNLFVIDNPVIIKKGQTKATLKIKVLQKLNTYKSLAKETNFTLNLKSVEGTKENIDFKSGAYTFTISPKENITPLTEEQKKLLKHYEEKGLNVAKWIGRIPVKTTVVTGADGTIDAFATSEVKNYESYTEITLSEKATKDKPVLKMTKNAFGLAEYLQWVFRKETIENREYWYVSNNPYAPPAPLYVLNALGEEKTQKWINKEYSFDVSVDNIVLNSDGTITFVRRDGAFSTLSNFLLPEEEREYRIAAINFEYHFPLWDDLKELAKNNSELQENILQGGSIHPNTYIGYSTITKDDWKGNSWVKPTGNYNNSEMSFTFNTDHTSSGEYDKVSVTFTSSY